MGERTIAGLAIASGTLVILHHSLAGEDVKRPLVGTFVSTVLLAGLNIAGLPQIAIGLAIVAFIAVLLRYGADTLQLLSNLEG